MPAKSAVELPTRRSPNWKRCSARSDTGGVPFWVLWNPDHFSASLEPIGRKPRQIQTANTYFKGEMARAVAQKPVWLHHQRARQSQLRHCLEATKLRPRCLIVVAIDSNGEFR